MAAGAALKKITDRVKALRKKHPKAKYKSLQQQAGKEYKAGKLKNKAARKKVSGVKKTARKKAASKKTARKRAPRVKVITRQITIGTIKRKRRKAAPKRKAARRRKVGGLGNSTLPIILGIGALAAVAYFALKPATPTAQLAYNPTGNQTTDNKAAEIMAWASAAGLGITAITSLINALNAGKVDAAYSGLQTSGTPFAGIAGYTPAGLIKAPYSDN